MRVKFWGVRGSLPTPLNQEGLTAKLFQALAGATGMDLTSADAIQAYLATLPFHISGVIGGNTTCVEVLSGEHTIVVDAGSGARPLGLSLLGREFGHGEGTLHLFFTHAHWDHLMGFPFFKPAYVKGNRIICYAVNHHPLEYLSHLMTEPTFFPIDPAKLPASLEFVTLREGETINIGGIKISNMHLHHPGIAYAFRFDDGDGSFVFASDAEFKTLTDDYLKGHLDFFRGADVLAFDAQFSLKDAFAYEDWGHSSALIGVDLAIQAGVRRLVTVHHDPNHTDRQIWEVAEAAQQYAQLSPGGENLEVTAGYEGLEIFLGEWEALKVVETLEDSVVVLALSGRLDARAGQELNGHIESLLSDTWRRQVVVDLSDLVSAEAQGVSALIEAVKRDGTPLALVVPTHLMRRVVAAPGQIERLAIYGDRAAAMAAMVGPRHLRMLGSVLAGRYELREPVATDDRAALYEAHDRQMDRRTLVQVLNPALTDEARTRYLDSVRAWGRLRHDSLIQVLDVLPDEGGLTALVLENLPPQTIKDYIHHAAPDGPGVVRAAVGVGRQLLSVLAYLHSQNLVHGELRPEAIFWNGEVKLSKIAPLMARGSGGIWLGPLAYCAPEQRAGLEPTPRTDLYAVGLILYQLLTGVHPYESESGEVTALRQMQGTPHSLTALNPTVPPALERFVLKLLALAPEDRFASADEAYRALLAQSTTISE